MAKTYESLEPLRAFIEAQPVFFVATAAPTGHVNLSPKGLDSLAITGERQVVWADLTGSGVETIAHLRADGRITIMFCAFWGPPKIVRLQGTGRAVLPDDEGFAELASLFKPFPGLRSIIVADLDRITDSCGYGVPEMTLTGERPLLEQWADKKGPDGVAAYQADRNASSIDGFPGLQR